MVDNLTSEQLREVTLGDIRDYAIRHNLTPEALRLIFDCGIASTHIARPDIWRDPDHKVAA